MEFEEQNLHVLSDAMARLSDGFNDLPAYEADQDLTGMKEVMVEVAERMQDNYPYHHPLYAGQMLKPPHCIARLAYMLALRPNPPSNGSARSTLS